MVNEDKEPINPPTMLVEDEAMVNGPPPSPSSMTATNGDADEADDEESDDYSKALVLYHRICNGNRCPQGSSPALLCELPPSSVTSKQLSNQLDNSIGRILGNIEENSEADLLYGSDQERGATLQVRKTVCFQEIL